MYAETRIYVDVNGQLHDKAALLLGRHFLILSEQDLSLTHGTVWRFGKQDKTK